jgi:hypothetical protein
VICDTSSSYIRAIIYYSMPCLVLDDERGSGCLLSVKGFVFCAIARSVHYSLSRQAGPVVVGVGFQLVGFQRPQQNRDFQSSGRSRYMRLCVIARRKRAPEAHPTADSPKPVGCPKLQTASSFQVPRDAPHRAKYKQNRTPTYQKAPTHLVFLGDLFF